MWTRCSASARCRPRCSAAIRTRGAACGRCGRRRRRAHRARCARGARRARGSPRATWPACRAASASASRWPACWRRTRCCGCSTSRCRTSTCTTQHAVMQLLRRRAEVEGRAVVASLHDLSLAARFATHALVFAGGGRCIAGRAAEVLTEATLSTAFGHRVRRLAEGELVALVAGMRLRSRLVGCALLLASPGGAGARPSSTTAAWPSSCAGRRGASSASRRTSPNCSSPRGGGHIVGVVEYSNYPGGGAAPAEGRRRECARPRTHRRAQARPRHGLAAGQPAGPARRARRARPAGLLQPAALARRDRAHLRALRRAGRHARHGRRRGARLPPTARGTARALPRPRHGDGVPPDLGPAADDGQRRAPDQPGAGAVRRPQRLRRSARRWCRTSRSRRCSTPTRR